MRRCRIFALLVLFSPDAVRASAFVFANGTYTAIAVPGAGQSTSAAGINDSGDIVGSFAYPSQGGLNGFLYEKGIFSVIDYPASALSGASGINNSGDIVGSAELPGQFFTIGWVDINGSFTDISLPDLHTVPAGINNSGQIVGTYGNGAVGGGALFLYQNGVFTFFSVPGAITESAGGINDSGEIVGSYTTGTGNTGHGFLYANGTFTQIDFPGAIPDTTSVTDINDSGQIVGYYLGTDGVFHGFLDSDGVFSTVDFPGSSLTLVYGINNADEVVGEYSPAIVTPEPASITLLLLGIGAMCMRRGRTFHKLDLLRDVLFTSGVTRCNLKSAHVQGRTTRGNVIVPRRSALSRELLTAWANVPFAELPSVVDEIVGECGRLPLALPVVGAMLRGEDAAFWTDMISVRSKEGSALTTGTDLLTY